MHCPNGSRCSKHRPPRRLHSSTRLWWQTLPPAEIDALPSFPINAQKPTPPCSSPPSVALRPRLAARLPMSGASWRAKAAECVSDERARPWSRRSPRALRFARRSWRLLHLRAHRHVRALSPRVAARSPMSGASLPATKAGECGRSSNSEGGRSSTSVRVSGRRVWRTMVAEILTA